MQGQTIDKENKDRNFSVSYVIVAQFLPSILTKHP